MKYFIASRWSNMKQVQLLTENLRSLGHEVFSYGTDDRNFVPSKDLQTPESTALQAGLSDPTLKAIFDRNLQGIVESETLILLFPAGATSHIEAGIAYGLNKKVVLIGQPEKAESHYLIAGAAYASIEEFITAIRGAAATA